MSSLAKNSTIYLVGSVFTAIGSIVSIPLLTHSLSVEDYGIYDLLLKISEVVTLTIFFGCRPAYIRIYFDHKSAEWQKKVTATMILFLLCMIFFILMLILCFKSYIFGSFIDFGRYREAFNLMILWVITEILYNMTLTFLMVNEKAAYYVSLSVFKVSIYLILLYSIVYRSSFGVKGVFLSNLIITASIALISMIKLLKWSKLKFSQKILIELLKFGLPILPTAVLSYLLLSMDRFFLVSNNYDIELGVFSFGSKIAFMAISLLFQPIGRIWAPFCFKRFNNSGGPRDIGLLFERIAILSSIGFVFLISLSYYYIPILAESQFYTAIHILPIVALNAILYNLSNLSDIGVLISKKTKYKPFIYMSSVIAALVFNFLLTPKYGMYGASISTLMGMICLFFATLIISHRCFYIPVNWKRLIFILILSIIFIIPGIMCHLSYVDIDNIAIVINMSSIFLFMWSIFLFGIIDKDEIKSLKLIYRKNIKWRTNRL